MSKQIPVELGPVQETLLIPLLARAVETAKPNGLLRDPKAVEIVDALDYDFDKWRVSGLVSACIRTRMFDDLVRTFLQHSPTGTIVEIGCGLNTRFERLDNNKAHWFEIDLADSIALRRRFFADTPRRTMIEGSAFETDWFDTVAATGGPWLFVAEAVLIYFDAEQVEQFVCNLRRRFTGASLLTDTICARFVERQDKHKLMRTLPQDSRFRWKCDDPAALAHWGLRLERSQVYSDASPEICARMPTLYRWMLRLTPWLVRRLVQGYHINRYVIEAST